jgi:Na+-driven multidrug efflux pump
MENELETMNIKKLSLKISMPMIISMISIALYSIVDTMFISRISSDALTTVSLSIPVQSIITAVGLGTSIGLSSLLAKNLGEKQFSKSKTIILNGFFLIFISWIVIFFLGIIGIKYFFDIFTDDISIKKLGIDYLTIITCFSLGNLYQILFEKILEANGKSKSSMIIQLSGAIINLILDPILMFGIGNIPALRN